jgi:uncharacterized glyoxalase superfamily protein PhnB
LARKAIYKHATQVNAVSYPDDGTSPVGTTEWNEDPAPQGMLGNTPTTATITIASGVATVTDSVTVVTSESSTSDTLQKLALTNTNDYDLVYLFGNTGHVITLEHGDLNADGEVSTISGANEVLSTLKPTILMRKGNYWYGYGGGAVTTPTDITVADTTDTTCFPALFESATGDLAPKTDAGLAYNAGTGVLTATGFAGPLTGAVTGNASGSSGSCTGNAATVTTNANLTGDVTSSGNAATIANNAVTLAKMAGGTDGELITYDASGDPAAVAVGTATHVLTSNGAGAAPTFQAAAGGGATIVHAFSNTTTAGYLGTASSFGTVGAGDRDIYIKKIDSNNEGIFTKIWKNGSAVEVQIA